MPNDNPRPPGLPPPSADLVMQILRTREAIARRFRPMFRRHELTEQQWHILHCLAEQDATDMTGLARRACIHPPSLSRIVPKLRARALIASHDDAIDQRRVRIELTPTGRAFVDAVAVEVAEVFATLRARIGLGRLDLAHEGLAGILAALEEEDAIPGDDADG